MSLWLQRSHGDHSYWDVAAANFKHAIGLCCELVVEHVNSFIHSGETGSRAPGETGPCGALTDFLFCRYRLRVSDEPDAERPVQAAGGLCV